MSLPGLRFLGLCGAFALLGMVDSIWPMLGVIFEYHNHPSKWWWGRLLPQARWTMLVAIAALAFFFYHWRDYKEIRVFRMAQIGWAMLLLLFMSLHFNLIDPIAHKDALIKDLKSLLMVFVLAATARTPGRLRLVMWVLVIGAAGLGLEAWRLPRRESGRLYGVGGADTYGDNALAGHFALIIPIVIHFLVRGVKWEKLLALGLGPFVLNGLILCSSRGGFVAASMGAGLYLVASLMRSGNRRLAGLTLVAGVVVFFTLIDQVYLDRLATLVGAIKGEHVETGSGRTEIWSAGIRLVEDHPGGLGGGGFRRLSPMYLPEELHTYDSAGRPVRSAHNSYLTVAADYGLHTFVIYMLLLFSVGRAYFRVWWKQDRAEADPYFGGQSLALGAGFGAFMVTSMFANRIHYDGFFWMIALSCAVRHGSTWLEKRHEEGDTGVQAIEDDMRVVGGFKVKTAVFFLAATLIAIL